MELAEYIKMDALEKNHWWFKAKRKYVDLLFSYFVSQPYREKHALDVGCGTGAILEMLQEHNFQATGIDPSVAALNYCREKGQAVAEGSATLIPFPDNTFDVVTAFDVLEHVGADKDAVQEIKRVLKPGGVFIATVPAHQFLFSYHDRALHHVRRYSKQSFNTLISSAFSVQYIGWIHSVILLPAIGLRMLVRKHTSAEESDVRDVSPWINAVMNFLYSIEFLFLKVFRHLPWGLSLIVVAKKESL